MNKTAVFYGPAGGSTENVARRIGELIGSDMCDLIPVGDATGDDLKEYKNIIFGIATIGNETWDSEPVKSGWFTFINELEEADLTGKVIALFGLGDHIRYPDHFVDAMGELYRIVNGKGVVPVGKVDQSGYEFNDSGAVVDNMFVGLPIDEVFEPDLTDKRIREWVSGIISEFQ